MQDKKILLMPLMIMLALSISGVAFSTWSDNVRIEGTVEMGTLTIAIDYEETPLCQEFYRDPDNGQLMPGEYCGKNVASCSISRVDLIVDPHTGKSGYKKAIWTIDDAYPCYHCSYINFKIRNIGNVAAHIVAVIVTGYDNMDKEELGLRWDVPYREGAFTNDVDGDGDNEDIINIEIGKLICEQIDPCTWYKTEIDLHFKQEAEECHTYTFEIVVIAIESAGL